MGPHFPHIIMAIEGGNSTEAIKKEAKVLIYRFMGSPVFLTVCVILPWLYPIRDSLWLSHCHPCQRHLIKVSIKFVTMTNIVLFMDRHVLNEEVIHSIHARVNCKTLWNQLVCRSFLVGFALFEAHHHWKNASTLIVSLGNWAAIPHDLSEFSCDW